MMPLTNKTRLLTLVFMLFAITLPLFSSLYLSDPNKNLLFQGVRQRKAGMDVSKKSKVISGRIFLLKDSQFTIKNVRLTFRGIKNREIYMDVYLLELDPQTAYSYVLSTEDARAGIRLGDYQFRLLSANKDLLTLEIDSLYGSKR